MAVNNNADDYANARVGIFFQGQPSYLTGQCVSLVKWFLGEMCGISDWQAARGNAKDFGNTLVSQGLAAEVDASQRKRGDIVVWKQDGGGYGHIGVLLAGDRVFEENAGLAGTPSQNVEGTIVYASRIDPLFAAWRRGSPSFYRVHSYVENQTVQGASTQGGDMVTTQDQLNRLYQAVLHRTRGAGEGEDVYLGKDSGFVFDDLYASQERATMLQNEANNTAALISQRDEANNALNAERQKDAGLATSLNDSQLALDEAKKKIELDQATIADLNGKLLTAQGQVEELKAAPAPSPTDASATDQTSKISLGGILGLLSLLKGKGNTMNQTSSTLSSFGSSLLSRKLIVSLIGAVVVFGNAYWNWGLTTDQVMTFLTPLLAYVGFEGFADIKSRTKQS